MISKKLEEDLHLNVILTKIQTESKKQKRNLKKFLRLMKFFRILRKDNNMTNMVSMRLIKVVLEGMDLILIILVRILITPQQRIFLMTFSVNKILLKTFSKVVILEEVGHKI